MFVLIHLLVGQAMAQSDPPDYRGLHPVWAADNEFCIGQQHEGKTWAAVEAEITSGQSRMVYLEPGMVVQLTNAVQISSIVRFAVESCDGSTGTATIVAHDGDRMFEVVNGNSELTVYEDVTLQGSSSTVTGDGGMIKSNGGHLYLYGTLSGGHASGDGGVLWMNGGFFQMADTASITGGEAGDDGGCLWALGANLDLFGESDIHDCVAADAGGGLYAFSSSLDADASSLGSLKLRDNHAAMGGGAYVYLSSVDLDGVDIGSNVAESMGGGLYVGTTDGAEVTLTNVRVHDNVMQPTSGTAQGAGIYTMSANLTMKSDTASCEPYPIDADVFCSEVRDNTGADSGGGIYVSNNSTPTLHSTALVHNESGALYVAQSQVTAEGLVVSDHDVWKGATGATIFVDRWSSSLNMSYSTIAENGDPADTGVHFQPAGGGGAGASGTLYANIVQNTIAGSPMGDENLVLDTLQVNGVNTADDPQFLVDDERSRFKVPETSPANLPGTVAGQVDPDIDNVERDTPWTRGALQAPPAEPVVP